MHWNGQTHFSAGSRRSVDGELAAKTLSPFLHAQESETALPNRFRSTKAVARIRDYQAELAGRVFEHDLRFAGAGMFRDVLQAFLGDPENAELDLVGQTGQ